MPQIMMQGRKKDIVLYLVIIISIFILLNSLHEQSTQAEIEASPMVTMQTGIFAGKEDQAPVFTLGSRAMSLQDLSVTADALVSFSYSVGEGVPEEWIQAAVDGKKKGLHLLIKLTEKDLKNKDFPEIIKQISRYDFPSENNLNFWVSLIPDQEISSKEYDQFYHKIWKNLDQENIENISLVWYPQETIFDLQNEFWHEIDGVGLNISRKTDLAKLESLYKIFANKKEIIINENIIDTHVYDLPQGMAFLEEFYYTLATKYPAVTAVYQSSDLSRADAKYRKAIDELKQKDWVTNSALENTDKPMFDVLSSEMVLSGKSEFLYLSRNDNNNQDIAYVEYKFNTGKIIQAIRPPFAISLDTNELPNGINSLTIVLYNRQSEIIHKQQLYVQVENENIPPRAERKGNSYSKEQKPVYNKAYIPVLMYHDFAQKVPKELSSSTVATELFEKHLKALIDHGYTPVTFYHLNQYLNKTAGLPAKPVIITMDDGYLSNYTMAYPLLKKYRVPATFFVSTGFMGVTTQFPHISWEQAREMEKSGLIDIQSHTHWHRLYSELPKDEVMYETSISFGLIEKNLGKRDVKVLAYPEFRNTADSRKWLEEQGVNLQVTNLANNKSVTSKQNVQRIHVHNGMSPQALINTIKKLTM